MNYSGKLFLAAAALVLSCSNIFAQAPQEPREAQDSTAVESPAFPEDAPMFKTDGTPKLYYIRDVNIHGVKYLNHEMLKSSAGLIPGDSIYLPSNFISNAISRLWSQRFFADVKIGADIEGDSLDLEVFLKERPRVYNWEFEGITKGKKKDLLEKLKLKRGSELSDYVLDKNKRLIQKYWADKGFRNAEVDVRIDNDTLRPGQAVTVTFLIDRKDKVKSAGLISRAIRSSRTSACAAPSRRRTRRASTSSSRRNSRRTTTKRTRRTSSTSTTRKATATSRS